MSKTSEIGDLQGVVAIRASAGGVEVLSDLAAGLSPDMPFADLMVLHAPAGAPSIPARIIARSGPLRTSAAAVRSPQEKVRLARDMRVLSERLSATTAVQG